VQGLTRKPGAIDLANIAAVKMQKLRKTGQLFRPISIFRPYLRQQVDKSTGAVTSVRSNKTPGLNDGPSMTNSQRLSLVRNALRQWISQHQPDAIDWQQPASEALLIRDGFFCGRRFRLANHQAVWFIEEDELKIRDAQGSVLVLLNAAQIDALARAWDARSIDAAAEHEPQAADEVASHDVAAHDSAAAAAVQDEVQTLSIRSHLESLENLENAPAETQHRRAA